MIFLFAESATAENALSVGIAGIVMSSLALVIGGAKYALDKIVDRHTKQDELRFSAKLQALETAQEQCKRESAECKEAHTKAREELMRTRAELAARDTRDKAELQRQIDELKKQVGKL